MHSHLEEKDQMELNKRCFKIDKPNALAMIAGLTMLKVTAIFYLF